MKKGKYVVILVIALILVISLVLVFSVLAEKQKKYDKLIYNSWNKLRDEYNSMKIVPFPGEPIEHELLYFSDGKIQFCITEEVGISTSSDEIEIGDEYKCKDYEYLLEDNKLIVNIDGKEITYLYEFLDNNQLMLNYVGDGFEYKFYYSSSVG